MKFTRTIQERLFIVEAKEAYQKEAEDLLTIVEEYFEENLENLDKIIESLESGELSLDDAIKEYENAMKLIKSSSKILNEAEGKLLKVIEKILILKLSAQKF